MVFETERLILRPWEDADAEDLYQYAKDPEVGPAAGWPVHSSVEDSLQVIRTVFAEPETYAVCRKEDNRAIGSIGLMTGKQSNLSLPDGEAEIGYWVGVPFWGQGLIPEAVRELCRHAFADLHMHTLWCGYFDGNEKSKRCQEKCGFVYHHANENILWNLTGEVLTEHVSCLTKEDWKKSISVRALQKTETGDALDLAWRVFSEYEAPEYSPEGVEEFRKCLQDEAYLQGIAYYGAFCDETMVGFLGIRRENCHICFFFVTGKYQRLGIGTKLFRRMSEEYKGKTITLNSSPYGVPFYLALGFQPTDREQTVNGIRFTPMIDRQGEGQFRLIKLSERRDLKEKAAEWFSGKWSVPKKAYLESIEASFSRQVPSWYLCLQEDRIIAGMGVIENDFHDRPDLAPNVCAVYTEAGYRCRGIAGKLLEFVCRDMAMHGIDTLYLLTDHTGFYERYGWTFFCMARSDGEDKPSRMYVHHSV